MASPAKLPTETMDTVARYFEKMDTGKIPELSNSRQRSISEGYIKRPILIRINQDLHGSCKGTDFQSSKTEHLKNEVIPESSEGRLEVSTNKEEQQQFPIRLSLREQQKFAALSKVVPGEIHHIPLNEKTPLPSIPKGRILLGGYRRRFFPFPGH